MIDYAQKNKAVFYRFGIDEYIILTLKPTFDTTKIINVAKNSWWDLAFNVVNFACKVDEEIGSAGEQPISNRLYRHTVSIMG